MKAYDHRPVWAYYKYAEYNRMPVQSALGQHVYGRVSQNHRIHPRIEVSESRQMSLGPPEQQGGLLIARQNILMC